MFKNLLVPVDLSDTDLVKPAIDAAITIARTSGGTVRLLSVMPLTPAGLAQFVPADFETQQIASAAEALEIVAKESGLDKDHVSTAVRTGSIHHEIIEEASAIGADLIVMSSHRPGLRTYFLGANAAHVVRHARCSVLVVRQ